MDNCQRNEQDLNSAELRSSEIRETWTKKLKNLFIDSVGEWKEGGHFWSKPGETQFTIGNVTKTLYCKIAVVFCTFYDLNQSKVVAT